MLKLYNNIICLKKKIQKKKSHKSKIKKENQLGNQLEHFGQEAWQMLYFQPFIFDKT